MAIKKPKQIIDMSTKELLEPYLPSYWTRVKYISVDTVNGQHICHRTVSYRKTDNELIIKTDKEQIFYNVGNVIRFYFEPEQPSPY